VQLCIDISSLQDIFICLTNVSVNVGALIHQVQLKIYHNLTSFAFYKINYIYNKKDSTCIEKI
jgi:hypothetical protein